MGHSKRYTESLSKVDRMEELELDDAVAKVRETATAKFDETVEVAIALGVDPRHADQMIRSTVTLPNGTGKTVRVLVLCKEDKAKEAGEAGADYVGLDDLAAKIQEGWSEFDSVLATPDVMPVVGRLGKILGPKGLMPNPKTGTVTNDIGDAVREIKGGRLAFRVDKYGILHVPVGKASFEQQKLYENVKALLATVQRLKPASAKGQYWKSIALSSTMGPGIKVSRASVIAALR